MHKIQPHLRQCETKNGSEATSYPVLPRFADVWKTSSVAQNRLDSGEGWSLRRLVNVESDGAHN